MLYAVREFDGVKSVLEDIALSIYKNNGKDQQCAGHVQHELKEKNLIFWTDANCSKGEYSNNNNNSNSELLDSLFHFWIEYYTECPPERLKMPVISQAVACVCS